MSRTNSHLLDAIFSVTRQQRFRSPPHPRTLRPSKHIRPHHPHQHHQHRNASNTPSPPPPPKNPGDDPNFTSIIDLPPQIVSTRRKHNRYGISLLALIPLTAFALGCWQVQRLQWKTDLIAKFEDRLVRNPLPLPPRIDASVVDEFDYRRVYATGKFRHDKEMLVGPRMHDGKDGYFVITPLERDGGRSSTILVNRGWVSKERKYQEDRRGEEALPTGEVTVSGLIREPWKKNAFTPDNVPAEGKFYFPDVSEMARVAGCEPVWVEETMVQGLLEAYRREEAGVPIGRAAEVNLRNNHVQYIVTWYSLSAATALMLWMVLRRKPSDIARRVRTSKEW